MIKNNNNKGFTFIEALIVSFIFLLVLGIIYSIYLFNHQSYIFGENMAEVIQNGRVILERASREIRQTKKIITSLPSERPGASDIVFQDGHILPISVTGSAQSGTASSIVLSASSSSADDYYKDMYIRITSGTGQGQSKKVYSYEGTSKTAIIEGQWDEAPDVSSSYKIDSSYYYINYYLNSGQVFRKVYTYCMSIDAVLCNSPETYVPYDFIPPPGGSLVQLELESAKIIGEYVDLFEFWSSSSLISIFIRLEKNDRAVNLEEKVFGRNL